MDTRTTVLRHLQNLQRKVPILLRRQLARTLRCHEPLRIIKIMRTLDKQPLETFRRVEPAAHGHIITVARENHIRA